MQKQTAKVKSTRKTGVRRTWSTLEKSTVNTGQSQRSTLVHVWSTVNTGQRMTWRLCQLGLTWHWHVSSGDVARADVAERMMYGLRWRRGFHECVDRRWTISVVPSKLKSEQYSQRWCEKQWSCAVWNSLRTVAAGPEPKDDAWMTSEVQRQKAAAAVVIGWSVKKKGSHTNEDRLLRKG